MPVNESQPFDFERPPYRDYVGALILFAIVCAGCVLWLGLDARAARRGHGAVAPHVTFPH